MKWIYLIKAELEGKEYYKIGITSRVPEKRLKELQTGNALKLELITTFQTNYGNLFEGTLHRIFSLEQEIGEWFALSNEQVMLFNETCVRVEGNLKLISEYKSF